MELADLRDRFPALDGLLVQTSGLLTRRRVVLAASDRVLSLAWWEQGEQRIINESEKRDLQKLYRGVFFNKNIKVGDYVTYNDIYYAFPRDADGISSDEFKPFVAESDFTEHLPICYSSNVTTQNILEKPLTKTIPNTLDSQQIITSGQQPTTQPKM